jgi:2-desacetyl-2-hydroxyethyl bacteriochlorophyllide A dehydrogenase
MRALVTRLLPDRRREKVLVTDSPDPPAPVGNQVRTQTVYSGVTNGTERNDLLGGNYAHADEDLPAGWGYQNVGRVIERGPDVRHIEVGDLLYMSADHVEYVVIPEDGLLAKLPPSVEPKQAALFGMASVAMHTCANAGLGVGDKALVVGMGCIGQIAAQIASIQGAWVTGCDVDAHRIDVARIIGAAEDVYEVSGEGWKTHIPDNHFDVVMDLAGVPGMEDRLIAAARHRGQVLFVAGRDKVSYTFNNGQGHEIVIKQNSHFTREDLANVCRLVGRGMVKIEPLIQDVAPVAEADRVYATLRDRPGKLLGTVFEW